MILCSCNKVTSKEVDSVESFDYYVVQATTGAGRKCGSCAPSIIDYLYKRKENERISKKLPL